jgi:intracellular sulfur oxidation DsrE/DsrF family protein
MKALGPIAVITADDPKAAADAKQPRLSRAGTLARFALTAVALAAVVGTFAYFGGWLTPHDLTPARLTDTFEPGETGLIYPLVPGHGGVVSLPRAAEQPRKGAKAVFDITADAKTGEVNQGLKHVARLLNLYGAAGLMARDVKIAAVFHGEADKAVLSDAAYAARFKVAANPNLPLIRDLQKAGVEVFVCGQSLHDLGFKAEEVAGEVPVADSAMLVLLNKQTDGYACVPAP